MSRTYFCDCFAIFVILCLIFLYVEARPFKTPDFVSEWRIIRSEPGFDRLDIFHGLRETPAFVQVQVRSNTTNNFGYIFPAVGLVPRDDDDNVPYAGIIHLYNDRLVTVCSYSENNHNRGRVIYTENTQYWEGPNTDASFEAYIRVRAWKLSSFPRPDYRIKGLNISAACAVGRDCLYEKRHGFREHPSFVIVRTQLLNPSSTFDGYMSDAVGSALMAYANDSSKQNGYVTYGFDTNLFRIWTDSSADGYVFKGDDGTAFHAGVRSGLLEIIAWKESSLTPSSTETIQLGSSAGIAFDKDRRINISSNTEDILVQLWAEASDGPNSKLRFAGSGSLAYSLAPTTTPCSYGGLTYAYTNSSIRTWKPGSSNIGNIICIPEIFAGGLYSQGSNNATSRAHIWIPQVTTLHWNCSRNEDCFDNHTICANSTCQCANGYYEDDGVCEKDLTCADNVLIIPEIERRARNYIISEDSDEEHFVDDSMLKTAWYSAKTNKGTYMIPEMTTSPPRQSCGSKYQAYINGTHPQLKSLRENPTQLFICYKDCTQSLTIQVRMCAGDNLQYQLQRMPLEDSAYCFDPPELLGITTFAEAPKVAEYSLDLSAELQFELVLNTYRPFYTFNCSPSVHFKESLFYTTYWFIGSNLLTALGPSREVMNLTESILQQRKQKMGIHMSCGLKLSSLEHGLLTNLTKSPEKYYGIKIEPTDLIIKKGGHATVKFEPTLPMGCEYKIKSNVSDYPDCMSMLAPFNKYTEGCDLRSVIHHSREPRCSSRLKAYMKHQSWTPGEQFEYKITTVDKDFGDGHLFRLSMSIKSTYQRIWRDYILEDIMVYVTHNDRYKNKMCYSHVDPHMQTADGTNYDNQHDGEFILYRNTKYDIEVQEKTTKCNQNRAWCACAIAIRAGGDVFLINTCGDLRFIGFTSCSDGGILDVRKRTSLRYQIYTPIGTFINIQMQPYPGYENLMNTEIHMAPKDFNNTEGLCGLMDDNKANDLKGRDGRIFSKYLPSFTDEWRIKPFENNYLLLQPAPVTTWQGENNDMFCYCQKSLDSYKGNISNLEEAVCSATMYENCTESKLSVTKDLCTQFRGRTRRSVSDYVRQTELQRRQTLVNKNNLERKRFSRAVQNTSISNQQAKTMCSNAIQSQAAVQQFGHRLNALNVDQAINECSFDVYEGNDEGWAEVYTSVLNQVIEATNERDPVYVKENKDEVENFNRQSCPRNCSGQGSCSNEGDCICFAGYHGPDCIIDENDPLEIHDIEGDGLCDLDYGQECRCFRFQTSNLLEKFHCKFTAKQIMINGTIQHTETMTEQGIYENIFNGECCMPIQRIRREMVQEDVFAREITISVSNNGASFGDNVTVTVYDSKCQTRILINGIFVVKIKENTCFVSKFCRLENETSQVDECGACIPKYDQFGWTHTCSSQGTNDRDRPGNTVYLVIGLTGGVVFAALIFGTCIVWKVTVGKKRKSVGDSAIFDAPPPKEMEKRYKPPARNLFSGKLVH